MLRTVLLGLAVVGLAACADDGGDEPGTGEVLAGRVLAVLQTDGGVIEGDLSGADVDCPVVRSQDEGDRATCVVRFADGREVEVDIEFQAGGAIAVVAVVPR